MCCMLPIKQAFQSSLHLHSRKHIFLAHFVWFPLCVSHLKRVFFWASFDGQMMVEYLNKKWTNKQTNKTKQKKQNKTKKIQPVKAEGRIEDVWPRPMWKGPILPLAIYLEDSNCSVNIHWTMLGEWTTRNDRSLYCAFNPVSKTLSQSL